MKIKTMRELFLEQIRDLYSGETQIIKALPKMVEAASNEELREGFSEHLQQTQTHVARLEDIFTRLDEKPGGVKCVGMEGVLKEGEEMIDDTEPGSVRDAGLIAAAQRVEHYEMAGYGSAREFARQLGDMSAVQLLEETLEEEKETDERLTEIAMSVVNDEANAGGAKISTGRAGFLG
jgi:ferritin-like metal-binding protein YciE